MPISYFFKLKQVIVWKSFVKIRSILAGVRVFTLVAVSVVVTILDMQIVQSSKPKQRNQSDD